MQHKEIIILTNEQALRQILINLVSNAIKFTEKGSVTIQTRTLSQEKSKINLNINIIDTGPGIPQEKLNMIFKPFMRLNHHNIDPNNTGLGLAIANKLAELMNITITATSVPDVISIFEINGEFETNQEVQQTAPSRCKKTTQPIVQNTESIYPGVITAKQPHILLIEDDFIAQYIHQKILTNLGCLVDILSLGRQLTTPFKEYAMIFIDANLPDISSLQLIQSIRKNHHYTNTPIIILSAYITRKEKIAYCKAGVKKCIKKPASQAYFKKILLHYLT